MLRGLKKMIPDEKISKCGKGEEHRNDKHAVNIDEQWLLKTIISRGI